MSTNLLQQMLAEREWLLADGATGTNYFAMGLQSGDAPELWNVDHPDRVASLHQQFIDAGADIITCNTYGNNAHVMGSPEFVEEANMLGVKIARDIANEAGREVFVAGSMSNHPPLVHMKKKIKEEGLSAHTEFGCYFLDDGVDESMIHHIDGRRWMTPEQRREMGLPLQAEM